MRLKAHKFRLASPPVVSRQMAAAPSGTGRRLLACPATPHDAPANVSTDDRLGGIMLMVAGAGVSLAGGVSAHVATIGDASKGP
jgi:hypothetical protein